MSYRTDDAELCTEYARRQESARKRLQSALAFEQRARQRGSFPELVRAIEAVREASARYYHECA